MSRSDTLIEGIAVAFEALRSNKIRTSLTILGVAVGVSVVVAMAALITGIRSSILEAFEAAGPDNFIVMPFDFTGIRITQGPSRPPWWDKPEITTEEIRRIGRLPAVREAISDFDFNVSFTYEGQRVPGIQASGNDAGWPAYTIGAFSGGRNFTQAEVEHARSVVVLSHQLAEELFGQLDPIGREVRGTTGARGVLETFTVVGTFLIEDNIFAQAAPHFAIFPHTTAKKRLKALNPFTFVSVLVVPREGWDPLVARDQVISAMRSMRGLHPSEENDFAIIQSSQLVDLFNRLTAMFFLVMLVLSSVGMMVGGIGVVGIMLISVTERTREIGVRKAVGATRREILWQFLVEAGALTLIGGALGMLLGWAFSEIVANFTPIPARIPLWSVFAALSAAVFTGMLFGLLPAIRASKLEPVVALRYE